MSAPTQKRHPAVNEVALRNNDPADDLLAASDYSTSFAAEVAAYPGQLRLRREASWHIEYGDPWRVGPVGPRGLAEAIEHILDAGMTPVADAGLMRQAWVDADMAGRQAIEAAARSQVLA